MTNFDTDVAIVGGGPVGLYLAFRLLDEGITCMVLEKKESVDRHSKSLGIHPVSLSLFDSCGLTESFLREGLKIRTGIAYWNRKEIGRISFDSLPGNHPYILALPQWRTETILADKVRALNIQSLVRGASVKEIDQDANAVHLRYDQNGESYGITARYAVGCDGKSGFMRDALNIPFEGTSYPDTYLMGDFSDNTAFGNDAAVYLHKYGLVECFPLPGGQRRWVVKTDSFIEHPCRGRLEDLIKKRLDISLQECENTMTSSFGVQHFMAGRFHENRCLIAGDAAHVVSPIGGQGMNLGWLDAEACFLTIRRALGNQDDIENLFRSYTARQQKIAKQVARRAELNMHLGRKEASNGFYRFMVTAMLTPPFSGMFAKVFTMHGLGKWPV